MTTYFHLAPVTGEHDRYLPGLSERPKHVLWLKPAGRDFQPADLQVLVEAFAPLKGIVWHALSTNQNDNNGDQGDPFEQWSGLAEGIVSEATLRLAAPRNTVYARVSWLSNTAFEVLSLFLRVRPLHGQGIVSFVPHDNFQASKWAKIAQGPSWLWLCRDWIANSPTPSLDADAVTRSYVDLTCDMSGSPGLLWVDSDVQIGLTFFGSEAFLTGVSAQLESSRNFVKDPGIFRKLDGKGFYFDMCR